MFTRFSQIFIQFIQVIFIFIVNNVYLNCITNTSTPHTHDTPHSPTSTIREEKKDTRHGGTAAGQRYTFRICWFVNKYIVIRLGLDINANGIYDTDTSL